LLAELAQASLQAGSLALANEQAQEARSLNETCVHAHQVAIISSLQSHDDAMVLEHLEAMADATPEMLFLLLPVLLDTDYAMYSPVLLRYWAAHRNLDLALTWLEYIASHQGQEDAEHWRKELGFTSETLRDSLRLAALFSPDDELRNHAIRWREQLKHYQCHHCGVQIEALRWQCPQCQQWGTMRSVRQEL